MRTRRAFLILAAVLVLVLLLAGSVAAEQPTTWFTFFAADAPDGTWQPGFHTYRFGFNWTDPAPGEHGSADFPLNVTEEAPLYPGYVLLRGWYMVARDPAATDECIRISDINPAQPTRFAVGWINDVPMTVQEFHSHIASMNAWAEWDGADQVTFTSHQMRPWGQTVVDTVWPNIQCDLTLRP